MCVVASINAFVDMGSSNYNVLKQDLENGLVEDRGVFCREGH